MIAQRGKNDEELPLMWEFPGGKLEEGETLEECILREIKEELELDIAVLGRYRRKSFIILTGGRFQSPFLMRKSGWPDAATCTRGRAMDIARRNKKLYIYASGFGSGRASARRTGRV